ncbi:MAG: hypothetical protein LBR20_05740 [Propionibacteriaceae bacterium]|nr:hypothetical protein [Propionibacteriaceae bacterium]
MNQETQPPLPLRRVALFSSGVGFFEHVGEVRGTAHLSLPFQPKEVSDVLKSLMILDPEPGAPTVSYPAEDTLPDTLSSLRPDLSHNPSTTELFNAIRGAEITVSTTSGAISGRILGVETRAGGSETGPSAFLSLFAGGQVQIVPLSSIQGYQLQDEALAADVERALGILFADASGGLCQLEIVLPGETSREVSLYYVAGAPVWKASYRLDFAGNRSSMQGWAIVDNTSDADWQDVQLSLLVGRPTSFRQDLVAPYYVGRPEVPLAIAGSAKVRTHEDEYAHEGGDDDSFIDAGAAQLGFLPRDFMQTPQSTPRFGKPSAPTSVKKVGEQFAFTFPRPVSLPRRQSAMLEFAEGQMEARRVSIFSGLGLNPGTEANPTLAVEMRNTLGSPLPAGAITVYEDGLYAGDALQEFLPEGTKRLFSYGDDLAVRGSFDFHLTETIASVVAAKGVLKVTTAVHERSCYQFSNDSNTKRVLVIEHPRKNGNILVEPVAPAAKTAKAFRFEIELPPGKTTFNVETQRPITQEHVLLEKDDQQLTCLIKKGTPKRVEDALLRAAELKQTEYEASETLKKWEVSEQRAVADQERIRENLQAVGVDTRSGANYQQRLDAAEARLEEIVARQDAAREAALKAKEAFLDYISALNIE